MEFAHWNSRYHVQRHFEILVLNFPVLAGHKYELVLLLALLIIGILHPFN